MDPVEKAPSKETHTVRVWVADKAGLLLTLLAAVTLAAYLGRLHYLLELTTHFRVFYLAAAIGLSACLFLLKSWRWAIFGTAVVVLNLGAALPYYWPRDVSTATPNLRVLEVNVLTSNHRYDQLLSLIHNQRPDLIALIEVDTAWLRGLSSLGRDYPYRFTTPREDNFGLAVFSRSPFTTKRVFELIEEVPAISAQLNVAGRPVTFLAFHTLPPGTPQMAVARDAQLKEVAERARNGGELTVVCGDLNATPWSPVFKDFVVSSGLKEARRGFGIQGTWPAQYSPCLIPLDHCFVSPEIGVRSFGTLPSIGSDHLPVLVELVVPDKR